ncbi:O-methyltransferase [Parvicella tangerina]|uniref:tRNA 5-hydroxyuridine methyltransferase n=1 Tax=Parvicella tangerina TaxID=2829795 RepID=A0A916JPM1_9FLAO|nr:class I SAM-dependent methyltransferase [Parvicella tangerina]CAG5085960.1 tRNA 5-hydroxyuridine methyltransferase [Parvicella tangerina]
MFRQATTYGKYLLQAKPFKGVEDLNISESLKKVFDKDRTFYSFLALDVVRNKNRMDERVLKVNDLGAGSKSTKRDQRSVKSIADSAVKTKKYAELMFRLVESFQSSTVLELGTSLGITTGYLSKANKDAKVYTLEGASEIANVARENFKLMKLTNVELIEGDFNDTLQSLVGRLDKIDLAYLDGNHRKEATLKYFDWILPKLNDQSIVVVDDINWSAGMKEAWIELVNRKETTLAINLFEMGLLFLDPKLKKEELLVRY